MPCPYCHDDPSVTVNCYCRPITNFEGQTVRSVSVVPYHDFWMVEFNTALASVILPWVDDNIGSEQYFIKNYCTLGFYDREQAVLCHLRFA